MRLRGRGQLACKLPFPLRSSLGEGSPERDGDSLFPLWAPLERVHGLEGGKKCENSSSGNSDRVVPHAKCHAHINSSIDELS